MTRSAQDRFLRTPSFRASVTAADLCLIDSGDPHFNWNLSMLSGLRKISRIDCNFEVIGAIPVFEMRNPKKSTLATSKRHLSKLDMRPYAERRFQTILVVPGVLPHPAHR